MAVTSFLTFYISSPLSEVLRNILAIHPSIYPYLPITIHVPPIINLSAFCNHFSLTCVSIIQHLIWISSIY